MNSLAKPLRNKLILILEPDEFFNGYISDGLTQAGAQILAPACTIDAAHTLVGQLENGAHAAVVSLDILEAGGAAMTEAFNRLAIPVLLTGDKVRKLPTSSLRREILIRPFAAHQVVDHLRTALSLPLADQPLRHVTGPVLRGH
jgi:hypothetical protein